MNRSATYLCTSITTQIFLRQVKLDGNAMIITVTETLRHNHKNDWILYNNQRVCPIKFHCFSSLINFVKITGRASRKCTVCETVAGEENGKHCMLTYVDQVEPNPMIFLNFELEITNIKSPDEVHMYMICGINNCTSTINVDITSTRVSN